MKKRIPVLCAALILLLPAGAVYANESKETAVFTVGFSGVAAEQLIYIGNRSI
jgi:hypothetical protein